MSKVSNDNLNVTLSRLMDEGGWSEEKVSQFVSWLTDKNLIKPGHRPGSRQVENLFEKKEEFERTHKEELWSKHCRNRGGAFYIC